MALALIAASLVLAPGASASLGRVVMLGDSLASGMGLGPRTGGSILACGQTTGSYPELVRARLGLPVASQPLASTGPWSNASCNGGHTGVFYGGWTGIPAYPGMQENDGTWIPPQFNTLGGNEQAVIVGTGGNEAYFGEVVDRCLGLPSNSQKLAEYGYPLPPGVNFTNGCIQTYGTDGVGLLRKVVGYGGVEGSEQKVEAAIADVKELAPAAKIFLVGVPRLVPADGAGCMPNPILTDADAPVLEVWQSELRAAMQRVANRQGIHFVDMNKISGDTHTMCAPEWSQRWINPWSVEYGLEYPGIALHNNPTGAAATAEAIVDAFAAEGLDTGSIATDPVVSITAPSGGLVTKNASVTLNFSASDNVRVEHCTHTSGQSVALAPGVNTITVRCFDDAGNEGVASVSVTRDNTPPQVTITSPANGTNTTASSIALNYLASDNVGTPDCSPASGTSRPLTMGANTLSVSCVDGAGNTGTAAVVVNRGTTPVVAISAPQNGLSTTAPTVNVAYTVDGAAAIPPQTACSVGGQPSLDASSNTFILAEGLNTITVACSNQFGTGPQKSVSVTGSPPSGVAVIDPVEGANTTAPLVNVVYLVSGAATIPPGTTCTVNGDPSTSTFFNPVELTPGANTITVVCTGAFGSPASSSIHVTRGNVPLVAITAPSDGSHTAAPAVNVSYRVNGSSAIPNGTSCTLGGIPSSSATNNNIALTLGVNTITVRCSNQFGQSAPASVSVTRGNPPLVAVTAPADGHNTTVSTANIHFSVDGQSTIPDGTTCKLGSLDTATPLDNPVSLTLGANAFNVTCTNLYGSHTASVTINRGTPPSVTINNPADGTKTATASILVDFTASDPSADCSVGGAPAAPSPASVPLVLGANTITIICSNQFGSGPASTVTVTRGNAPQVQISAPLDNFTTTAQSVNVAYRVDGASETIPAGVTCTLDAQPSSSPQAVNNPRTLELGPNTISVACTNEFGTGSAAVTVTRGKAPSVEIVSPSDGTNTTATSVNVSFTVNGAPQIPLGTQCSISGNPTLSTTTNNIPLIVVGTNHISVSCTNASGTGTDMAAVHRGNGPAVAISAPAGDALTTTAASTEVVFTVNNLATIPAGTNCKVNDEPVATTNRTVALAPGLNAITVACTNNHGTDSREVTVLREGSAPWVLINAAPNTVTPESPVNVTWRLEGVDQNAAIPEGTTCTINGRPTTSFSVNALSLQPGPNTVTVTCANDFGESSAVVTVTYEPPAPEPQDPKTEDVPAPPAETPTTPSAPLKPKKLSVKLGSKKPLKPARRGGMFTRRDGLPLSIKLDVAASVKLRIERLPQKRRGKSKLVGSSKLKLGSGTSKLRFSGRVGKRTLKAGRYRISVSIPGTKLKRASKIFRVKR